MRSISTKMVLAFIAIGVISIVVISVIARVNTRAEFIRFLSDQTQTGLISDLSDYHRTNRSWAGIDKFFAPGMEHAQGIGPVHGPGMMQTFTLADEHGTVLVSRMNYKTGEPLSRVDLENGIPITEDGQVIGVLVPNHLPFEGNPREVEFIETTNRTLLYAALAGALIALLLGIFLSRTLTRPIRELTRATHAVSQGDLSQQVTIHSNDELGELALAFNKMSSELSRSINARKQMTADIAHELRTPLSLILGHAEAVHDGVLPPTHENFEIIRDEALRLEHLVNDLRTLSLADAGELAIHLEPVEPARLLQDVASLYRYQTQKKNIALELDIPSPLSTLEADPGRMTQVLTNILDNALRYTPEKGTIVLSARQRGDEIKISIEDGGPGLPPEELERIFERFYRADTSRQREDGGSGLGLAIAKSIIQAHGGQLSAESVAGKGLRVTITLPRKP